jgi:nucleoside-diphosphate-sugar epimerase
MRCLVTGGTGFIGRRLVRRLVDVFGVGDVVCLVKPAVTPLEAAALEQYRSIGLRLIEGDLVDDPVTADPPPSVDVVFHLAANIDTDASEHDLRVNDQGTDHLLAWLAPVSRGARIVYASSVAVHDRAREPTGPISEDSPFVPRTGYGRTKLEGERIIQRRAAGDGYTWTILRLPTVYGPGQKPDGLFDQLIKRASRGGLLARINWPGRTSVVYVDDVADVMIDAAFMPAAADEVYGLASADVLTVGDLARRIGASIGRPVEPIDIPRPMLRLTRMLVWNRVAQAAMPPLARLHFWRLSLVVSDGFWVDPAKFRRLYAKPLRSLEDGLGEMREINRYAEQRSR